MVTDDQTALLAGVRQREKDVLYLQHGLEEVLLGVESGLGVRTLNLTPLPSTTVIVSGDR